LGQLRIIGTYWDKIVEFLFIDVYYSIEGFFSRYIERIGRTLAFARFAWLNYDFDSAYLWDLIAFKLKRLRKCLVNGIAEQEEEHMAALSEAIEICERLFAEDYEEKHMALHDQKWGELKFWTEPFNYENSKPLYHVFKSSRPNIKTDEDKQLERDELIKCMFDADKDREKDLDRLNELFKMYSRTWWE
jgi:hypothetical protein